MAPLSNEALKGTWKITVAQGTEWEKGKGIVTPKASSPDDVGRTLTFLLPSEVQIKESNGTSVGNTGFVLDVANSTLTITGVGLFNIKNFVAGKSMEMEQREPIDSDYRDVSGKLLYFQKFWTLQKQ